MSEKIVIEKTVAAQVTERLRDDIISRKLETGAHITIKEISERYGTSHMPVREAFRTLEGEHLLTINAYKGATVQGIDRDVMNDVYELLRALECLVYETILPDINEDILNELRTANERIKEAGTGEIEAERFLELNSAFHNIITGLCRNKWALNLYQYYNRLVQAARKSYRPNMERTMASALEHDELIEALEAKDPIALKKTVDAHVRNAREDFFRHYDSEV